jgi:hypothetical protein
MRQAKRGPRERPGPSHAKALRMSAPVQTTLERPA